VQQQLFQAGLRCGEDLSDEKVGAKIAKTHAEKVPYMLVVGPKEAESNAVSVRFRGRQDSQTMPVGQCLEAIRRKNDQKDIDVAF